ncbi:hypothetical protein RYA05_04600 [Pseudomonas syringae pv. actinidiae]|nr:hypothetical protein [Pseudomonas syringae pv. actinidiae]
MNNSLFGFKPYPQLSKAIDRTVETFEAMPADQVFDLARQHAGGDIAAFVKATSAHANYPVALALDKFSEVAALAGMDLPAQLQHLIELDLNRYDDYVSHHNHKLTAFSANHELEWIDPLDATAIIETWLCARFQGGARFLPFAESGAGDAYCFIELPSGESGVGTVWNDSVMSHIEYASLGDFFFAKLVEEFSDVSELRRDDVIDVLNADLNSVRWFLTLDQQRVLDALLAKTPVSRPYQYGPMAPLEYVLSLVSQEEMKILLATAKLAEPIAFAVVQPWECEDDND